MRRTLAFALLLAGCTRQIEVSAIEAGSDYRGLTEYERQEFDWAAIDVAVSADVARSFRRAESSNVTLHLFRCDEPGDAYPAHATMAGELFDSDALPEPLGDRVTLTFYLPMHVHQRERYECAALDARGYWPEFFRSQTIRLPELRFVSFRGQANQAPSLVR